MESSAPHCVTSQRATGTQPTSTNPISSPSRPLGPSKAAICKYIYNDLKSAIMKQALDSVNKRIISALAQRNAASGANHQIPASTRLVAVSKLKPVSDIVEAYSQGQRFFGENYIQELETKANTEEILVKCPDIRWHFIGHLQSNKVNKLLKIKNLYVVETVDSINLAKQIDRAIERYQRENNDSSVREIFCDNNRLRVMVQVNTSGEEQKNGIEASQVVELVKYIVDECKWLELIGLMTIGRLQGNVEDDFRCLYNLRSELSSKLLPATMDLELSMGMSGDFEQAILMGSTNVRVGSLIFGQRPPKKV